ncbi:unnamed protein product [Diabrotica balteata]|uniref:Autophagy-related protein 2 n=1 Tax=Diabrotica balteata TaxID=107213 RepID=A0A9N9T2R7_DIABA|nr:unnamed protein product [Diabrotica balteata]
MRRMKGFRKRRRKRKKLTRKKIRKKTFNGQRNVIKFGYISGTQEIRVKLKQSESLTGPKVSIDVMLGSFIVFLSPRQFHVLLELADGLSKPDTVDKSNVAPRSQCTSKPMTVLDYQRVEQELQYQLQSLSELQIAGLQAAQGWSSAPLDDNTADDNFLPMKNTVSGMFDSTLSGISSSMESSMNSSMISSMTDHTHRTRRLTNNVDSDPTAEISNFQIRIASVAVILLLEDLLFQPVERDQILAPSSVQKMQQVVDDFFGKLGQFSFAAYGNKDFENAREAFNNACSRNNLKLLAAPVQIEGDEKTTSSAFSISGQLTAAKLELYECLYNTATSRIDSIPLISFTENSSLQNATMGAKPSFKLAFKHVEKTKNSIRRSGPKSDITITLGKLDLEFDITLLDRINALINSPNICAPEVSPYNPWTIPEGFPGHIISAAAVEAKMDLKIICPCVNVKLRFPVPDFRPPYDLNRVPWWKRHVRADYLSLVFADLVFQSSFQTNQSFQEYSLNSRALDIIYYENENSSGLPIAKAEFDDREGSSMQDVLSQIRLTIKLFSTETNELEKEAEVEQNLMTTSFYGAFENQNKEEPGPFSAKRVVHESDTPHSRPPNDMMGIPSQSSTIKPFGSPVGSHLHPTIYKSEQGMLVTSKNRGGNREMLTIAIRIQANHETHHVKTVRVAIGLNKSTLKHRMCTEPNSWISHLLDFFNVQDYPIANYHAKDVLTELHLHVWDCAIDYRPLNLAIRSAITIGNFSMSSHLSAQSNSSTLRFIFEECALFLSEKAPSKNGKVSVAPVDLIRDYVNVLQLGLFELSLRTTDKRSGINPHIDLRASNNILNIHTCADSCKMLTNLIIYFANDGDLVPPTSTTTGSSYSSPRHQAEAELVSVEPQISNLSKSQHEHVNTLLGEAMKESEVVEDNPMHSSNLGAKLFYFPDEKQLIQQETLSKPLPQVTYELGDIAYHSSRSSDTDDEFCIIGKEPGLGLYPANGIPDIRWLSSDPVRVIDNHFNIPVGKTDLLKPPKSFPIPITRYTLCDMTVVWHMYGGNDFKVAESENKKKTVQFSETQLNDTVSFSKGNKNEVHITSHMDKKKANMNWIVKGGVNRDHDVHMELHLNKVRFQHEVYPETTTQASRQVLIISDVEIVDRLESSQINKFLYQYTSQSRPKQSHAHMVVIKSLHIRPDPKLPTQECCLKVSILPLRLNIDQDSLLFLINFFSDLSGDSCEKTDDQGNISKHNTPTHHPPVMTISEENEELIKKQALKVVDENLILLMEESRHQFDLDNDLENSTSTTSDGSPVFFRNLIFSPEVPIRLDYHGKRVDMTHGSLPGLLMGLGQLNCSELRLKRVTYRHGLLGFDKLMMHLVQEWLSDIKKNQLPSLLGGVGPMYTLVQLFQGVRDLFWLPIEQYQKDGRIVRGLQRGANSFTTSTAMAALELTSRIIHLIQITAETAYDMLSPGPSVRILAKSKGKRRRYHQPQDIREGMTNAILLVKEGIGETADNIVQVAAQEKEQKGYSGAVGGVLRQIPPTILKPIIIASEATSNVLGGMRSQLVPDARREANQKWRSNDGVYCDKN